MSDSIYIGNFSKGLTTNPLPYNIDNDAFPQMYNFYTWRGRAKKKRGTIFLGRLTRQIQRVLNATPPSSFQFGGIILVANAGNLLSSLITLVPNANPTVITMAGGHIFTVGDLITIAGVVGMIGLNGNWTVLDTTATTITVVYDSSAAPAYVSGGTVSFTNQFANIKPGTINLSNGGNTYTDTTVLNPVPNGTIYLNGGATTVGTINYATGAIVITGTAGQVVGTYGYFPTLPAMGTEDFSSTPATLNYPSLLAFDTYYSYQCNQAEVNANFFNVNFYKTSQVPFRWYGQDFQQFYYTNYQGALWTTNGNPGFNFLNGTYVAGSGTAVITFNFTTGITAFHELVVGDVLWFNEWAGGSTINGMTGIVTAIINAAIGQYQVTFTSNRVVAGTGITQMLTNTKVGQDGIKWYDGDPTSGTGLPTATGEGWVNFAPPLTATTVSINDLPFATYYLVGALIVIPFKDRLLFFNVTLGTSSGTTINLPDVCIWSQNGTPYYTVDAAGNPTVVPINQTANLDAWYVDQTGKGGWESAAIGNPILTVGDNEDALIVGFGGDGRKTRFVYTGNDFDPFLFFNINSELPSFSTYAVVNLDSGILDIGTYGIAITDQQSSRRIDLEIPDSVFQIQNLNNGTQRINGIRDFFREWIYFNYPIISSSYKFPTQSLLYNYRNNTWGYLYENFTTQGYYRPSTGLTWGTLPYNSWAEWREPWNAGSGSALFPNVIAGTPQGFYLIKSQSTQEAQCCTILNLVDDGTGLTLVTSPNHCVSADNPNIGGGDYILFNNVIGLKSATITGIILGTTTTITCVNTFTVNKFVTLSGIVGTEQLNGNTYMITGVTGTAITILVNSTGFTPWVSGGTAVSAINELSCRVLRVIDDNNFVADLVSPEFVSAYIGLGTFAKLCQPLLQTKQFPLYWNMGRQMRLCVQKYLMDYTANGEVTVQIYLSQDPDMAYSDPVNVPPPNALIYTETLFTCPESTNLGLTPANTNLQIPTAEGSYQIWHRSNTSLIGASVQIGITLSDAQMRDPVLAQSEITLHGMVLVVERGPHLA